MSLNGKHIAQIQRAFLDTFSLEELRQFVRIHLDENLDEIAGGRNFAVTTHDLIAWAERKGRIREMIDAALRQNPKNRQMQVLAEQPWIATADSLSARHVQQRSHGQTWQGRLPARLWTVALVIALLVAILAIVVVMTPSDQLHTTTLTPITANSSEHSSHSIDLDLASPYVDGLQLRVTRVEESNGVIKVEVTANHTSIGLEPFGPRNLVYAQRGEQMQEAESEEQEWRNLQSGEFIFQDEAGRVYEVDASRSDWDREVIPNDTFKGFMTISDTLPSSVSQLGMNYLDIYRGKRVPIRIDGIPMPKQGVAQMPPQSDTSMADCGFITSIPQKDHEYRVQEDRLWLESYQLSGPDSQDIFDFINGVTPEPQTPTPTPVSGEREVGLVSDTVCGITLGITSVKRDESGTITLDMYLSNEDLPYSLSLGSLIFKVANNNRSVYEEHLGYGNLHSVMRLKGVYPFSETLYSDIPNDARELSVSMKLPGGQVLMLDHIPLPVVPDELLASVSEHVVKVNQSQTIAPGVTATILSAEWGIGSSSLRMLIELANDSEQYAGILGNVLIKDDQQYVLFTGKPSNMEHDSRWRGLSAPPHSKIQETYDFEVEIPRNVKSVSVQLNGVVYEGTSTPSDLLAFVQSTDEIIFEGVPVPPGRP